MEVKTNLPALTSRVMTLLKRKKFRPSTLESYQLTWRRIEEYMTGQGITEFTKEVGEAFIKKRFGEQPYDELKMHERNCIYYTLVLWHYQANRTLPASAKKKPDFVFSGKLGALFKEYLAFKAETCAPPTLRLYRY